MFRSEKITTSWKKVIHSIISWVCLTLNDDRKNAQDWFVGSLIFI